MTQSLLCWNHPKSFLRSKLVILACSLWETLEIICHLQTLSQSDYRKKKIISGTSHWWFHIKVSVKIIKRTRLIFSLSHFLISRAWITTLSQTKYIKKKKNGNINICSLTHHSFSSIKQVTLNWANQNIYR